MKTEQISWSPDKGWNFKEDGLGASAQLVLVFGYRQELVKPEHYSLISQHYPLAQLVMTSTAGEIKQADVEEGKLVLTAVAFGKSRVQASAIKILNSQDSYFVGRQLVEALPVQELVHVLIFSDGQLVNGSELAKGISDSLPAGVHATGGLAGDYMDFEETVVGLNNPPAPGNLVALGFYGRQLEVGWGCGGGWDSFGPDRTITRAKGNLLYELDGKPALDLYKKYLGPRAKELPGAALLFPLSLRMPDGGEALVRTVLHIDEEEQSMRFAGDVPEGCRIRLMKANHDRLVDGAVQAADHSLKHLTGQAELAILISCVGRRAVLGQRVEEELEEVQQVFGTSTCIAGFYSYGELSPVPKKACTELHNQTMTITALREL